MTTTGGGRVKTDGTVMRTLVVMALVVAVAVVLIVRERNGADARGAVVSSTSGEQSLTDSCSEDARRSAGCGIGGSCIKRGSFVPSASGEVGAVVAVEGVPRLLDLGSDSCVPCKAMAPILDEMRSEFEGALDVEVVDVRRDPEAARLYGVKVIPTQVFLDPEGNELFRHQGFYSREEILAKWAELGYSFEDHTE